MKLAELGLRLRELEDSQRLRVPDDLLVRTEMMDTWGQDFIDAARNDYLGLAAGSPVFPPGKVGAVSRETFTEKAAEPPAVGAGASRLIFGSTPEHLSLEREVATWLGLPAALLFSSGYSANVGALSALLSEGDAVFSDELNHASLIDGMRLARVKPQVFAHLDLGQLEQGLEGAALSPARWVVVEAYYSMDGDGPDLAELRRLCDRYDAALYVDEAHSVGTFGPAGAGLCCRQGVRPDVLMAAFGKAVGSQGACVLGSTDLRTWLWNRARSFVFSTAPSPAHVALLRAQIAATRAAHGARDRLEITVKRVREALAAEGVAVVERSFGPVLGLICGEEGSALRLAEALREHGILAQAIRPPTVPTGASRVRLILTATLTDAQIDRLVQNVARETRALEKHA